MGDQCKQQVQQINEKEHPDIETLSRPSPSAVVPAATWKAAGRINAIAESVSIVA